MLFVLGTLTTGCEFNETPLDEDIVAQNAGAVLTTISTEGTAINLLNIGDTDLITSVYFNDFENNDSLESVELFLEFADTTPVNGEVIEKDEAAIATIPASEFVVGDSGFPENTFKINGQAMLDAFGLNINEIDGGDLFIVRYKLNLKDGRSFSSADTGTNVRTTSHVAPFRYSTVVACFKTPEAGDWELTMKDVFGDGWNGGKIVVLIDGVATEYSASGAETVATITVPAGTSRFLVTYVAGDWEGENTYVLKDPNGATILEDGSGDGSRNNGPSEGEQFNTCD